MANHVTRLAKKLPIPLKRKDKKMDMAGGEGFEPPIDFHLCQFSRLVHSTTLPPARMQVAWFAKHAVIGFCAVFKPVLYSKLRLGWMLRNYQPCKKTRR